MSAESVDEESCAEATRALEPDEPHAEDEADAPHVRRPRPTGARCDACHERGARVVRSRDGLLTVCTRCARGVELPKNDSAEAIVAVVNRAPIGERRLLMRRLLARRALHTLRRDRKAPRPSTPEEG